MWKMLAACLTAFLITTSAPVYAESMVLLETE